MHAGKQKVQMYSAVQCRVLVLLVYKCKAHAEQPSSCFVNVQEEALIQNSTLLQQDSKRSLLQLFHPSQTACTAQGIYTSTYMVVTYLDLLTVQSLHGWHINIRSQLSSVCCSHDAALLHGRL